MKTKFKDVCPSCFMNSGYSIEMKDAGEGVFQCPNIQEHRFKRDTDGFWKRV